MKKLPVHFLLAALLFSAIQQSNAIEFENSPKNIALLAGGSMTVMLLTAAISATVGWQCSNSKYDYQAQKDKQDLQEKKADRKREAQETFERTRRDERATLRQVDHFLKPFLPLFEEFKGISPEQLARNQQFHALLTQLIFGTSAHTDRIGTLNQEIWQHQKNLQVIENPDLTSVVTEKLHVIQWIKQHTNNSTHARLAQQEIEKQHLALKQEKHQTSITKEQAQQEKIKTATIKKEAQLRQQAAQQLADTAQGIKNQLDQIGTYVEREMQDLRHEHTEHMKKLVAWQAQRAHEHAETRQQFEAMQDEYARLERLLITVENTCQTLQHFMSNFAQQLARIEDGQRNQTAYLEQAMRNFLEKQTAILAQHMAGQLSHTEKRILAQTLQYIRALQDQLSQAPMPQPSAPPMGPEDEVGAHDYNPTLYDAQK